MDASEIGELPELWRVDAARAARAAVHCEELFGGLPRTWSTALNEGLLPAARSKGWDAIPLEGDSIWWDGEVEALFRYVTDPNCVARAMWPGDSEGCGHPIPMMWPPCYERGGHAVPTDVAIFGWAGRAGVATSS